MRGEKADLCLTDPPYGVDLDYSKFKDTESALRGLSQKWFPLWRETSTTLVFTPGVTQQWFYPEPNWVMCWFYGGGQFRSPWGFNCWQPILAYGKDPSLAQGKGCRPDAVDMNQPANAAELKHPCPKPLKLWEWLLDRTSMEKTDLICDPFLGSGTTLIAAEKTGRICYGMEIDPKYCDVIIKRYADYAKVDEDGIRATRETNG
jgi:DNA modification methylase